MGSGQRNTVRTALRSDTPPAYRRKAWGSIVDPFEPEIRRLLMTTPRMPTTMIAERIGWTRSLTVLKERVRELRPLFVPPDPSGRTPSGPAPARRICSNSSTFDLFAMRPRLQPTCSQPVDPSVAGCHVGADRLDKVVPSQVITPTPSLTTAAAAVATASGREEPWGARQRVPVVGRCAATAPVAPRGRGPWTSLHRSAAPPSCSSLPQVPPQSQPRAALQSTGRPIQHLQFRRCCSYPLTPSPIRRLTTRHAPASKYLPLYLVPGTRHGHRCSRRIDNCNCARAACGMCRPRTCERLKCRRARSYWKRSICRR
jgi:hypothetical protein